MPHHTQVCAKGLLTKGKLNTKVRFRGVQRTKVVEVPGVPVTRVDETRRLPVSRTPTQNLRNLQPGFSPCAVWVVYSAGFEVVRRCGPTFPLKPSLCLGQWTSFFPLEPLVGGWTMSRSLPVRRKLVRGVTSSSNVDPIPIRNCVLVCQTIS